MATPVTAPLSAAPQPQFAGIGERFVAVLIDGIILAIALYVVRIPIAMIVGQLMAAFIMLPINLVAGIAYEAYFLSSPKQATIGKQAMGIIVTDVNGNAIDMQKAAIRGFGKIISSVILLLGYIMAFFTPKKQALHDMIANTIVVKGKR